MQNLIKQRNAILNVYQEIREVIEGADFPFSFNKEDILMSDKLFKRFKQEGFLTHHNVWEIPVKTHSNEKYEGGELSE